MEANHYIDVKIYFNFRLRTVYTKERKRGTQTETDRGRQADKQTDKWTVYRQAIQTEIDRDHDV